MIRRTNQSVGPTLFLSRALLIDLFDVFFSWGLDNVLVKVWNESSIDDRATGLPKRYENKVN